MAHDSGLNSTVAAMTTTQRRARLAEINRDAAAATDNRSWNFEEWFCLMRAIPEKAAAMDRACQTRAAKRNRSIAGR